VQIEFGKVSASVSSKEQAFPATIGPCGKPFRFNPAFCFSRLDLFTFQIVELSRNLPTDPSNYPGAVSARLAY